MQVRQYFCNSGQQKCLQCRWQIDWVSCSTLALQSCRLRQNSVNPSVCWLEWNSPWLVLYRFPAGLQDASRLHHWVCRAGEIWLQELPYLQDTAAQEVLGTETGQFHDRQTESHTPAFGMDSYRVQTPGAVRIVYVFPEICGKNFSVVLGSWGWDFNNLLFGIFLSFCFFVMVCLISAFFFPWNLEWVT